MAILKAQSSTFSLSKFGRNVIMKRFPFHSLFEMFRGLTVKVNYLNGKQLITS